MSSKLPTYSLSSISSISSIYNILKKPSKYDIILNNDLIVVHDTKNCYLLDICTNNINNIEDTKNGEITCFIWFYLTKTLVVLMIGYENGAINIYDKLGKLLISQHLHVSKLLNMKNNLIYDIHYQSDLLLIYSDTLVYISGIEIFDSLTNLNINISRCWRFNKYRVSGMNNYEDIISIDSLLTPMTASTLAFVGVGNQPILTYFPAYTSSNAYSAIQLATKVATKLTSAVFSFATKFTPWSTTKQQTVEEIAQNTPATMLTINFTISDPARTINSISFSPTRQFLVTCDSLGRVILFDATSIVAIKWWKGYRDAQIAGLLFLVIYLPRRDLVEIWKAPLGLRIVAIPLSSKCKLKWYTSYENDECNASSLIIKEDGEVLQINIASEVLQMEKRHLYFHRELAVPSLGESLFTECKTEIKLWRRNHLCASCIPTIDSENFDIDPNVDSTTLFELLSQLTLVPMDDNITIDYILTEFFPTLRSLNIYSNIETKSEESDVCVGYISDVLSLCIRAISESIKLNINTDMLNENQLVRLEMCGKRLSLFSGLTKLWISSMACKDHYNAFEINLESNLVKYKDKIVINNVTPIRRRPRTSKTSSIIDADKGFGDIDSFNLNNFDSVPESIPSKQNTTHLLYSSDSKINLNFNFQQFLLMFRLDISTLSLNLDSTISDSVKQQAGFVIFSSFLAAKFAFNDSAIFEETDPLFEDIFDSKVRASVEAHLNSLYILLSPFNSEELLNLFIPWLASIKKEFFLVDDRSYSMLQYSLICLLARFIKIKPSSADYFKNALACCIEACGDKIPNAYMLSKISKLLSENGEKWDLTIEKMSTINKTFIALNPYNSAILSLKNFDMNSSSIYSLVSQYIIDQSLPLPVILHGLSRTFRSHATVLFKCNTFEILLKETIEKITRDNLISKTDKLIETLIKITSIYPIHFTSDMQLVMHLITTLAYKWLDHKMSLCFVPLTFNGKNSLTIYLPDKAPQLISECISSSKNSHVVADKRSHDNYLEQAVTLLEVLPNSIASTSVALYLFQSCIAPILFAFSQFSSKSFHSFLSSLRITPIKAATYMRLSQRILLYLTDSVHSSKISSSAKLFPYSEIPIHLNEFEYLINLISPINWPSASDDFCLSLLELYHLFMSNKNNLKNIELQLSVSQTFALLIELNIDSTSGNNNLIGFLFNDYSPDLIPSDSLKSIYKKLPFAVVGDLARLIKPRPNHLMSRIEFLFSVLRHSVEMEHRIDSIPSLIALSNSLIGSEGPDKVILEYVRVFFERCCDNIGEEYLSQVSNKSLIWIVLLEIIQERFATILQFLALIHTQPSKSLSFDIYPSVMSTVAIDTINMISKFRISSNTKKFYVPTSQSMDGLIKNLTNLISRTISILPPNILNEKSKLQSLSNAARQIGQLWKVNYK